jgi:membrane protease YdiL (CAAX protease family)
MRPIQSALLGYAVAFVATIVVSLLALAILFPVQGDEDTERVFEQLPVLLVGGVVSSAVLTLTALGAAGSPRRQRLRLVPAGVSAGVVLVMVLGVLTLGQALESLSFVLGVGEGGSMGMFRRVLTGISGVPLLLAVLVIGILAPFAEELFFRGFIQTRFRERWPVGPAIVVSAVCFAALHLEWVHATLAFVLGLYLGFVTEAAGSIRPAILCHLVNNTASTLLTAAFGSVTGFWPHLFLASLTTAVFIVSVMVLRSMLPPNAGMGGPVVAVEAAVEYSKEPLE